MPECAELRPAASSVVVSPVTVLPLWRRGEDGPDRGADRPGVPRGHSGPVAAGQSGRAGQGGRAGQDGTGEVEPVG